MKQNWRTGSCAAMVAVAAFVLNLTNTSAQSTAESLQSESEPQTAQGPRLLDANEPASTEETMPQPPTAQNAEAPAREAPNLSSRLAPARTSPGDDLPPPRQPQSEPAHQTMDHHGELGLTLVGRAGAVTVRAVEPQSPAARAGFQRGDVIWAINDQRVDSVQEMRALVDSMEPGEPLDINFSRDISTQVVFDDAAVEPAGYEEELPSERYTARTSDYDQRNERYWEGPYRDGARYRGSTEDLPLPRYTRSETRRAFYYTQDVPDSRRVYVAPAPRRDDDDADDDRRFLFRGRDGEDRPLRGRPLRPWRRN